MGYVQTENSHAAVTKTIHLDKEEQIDANERYLWALAFSPHPNSEIIRDLLKKFVREDNIPDKVQETLILTLASMAQKLFTKPDGSSKVILINLLFNYFLMLKFRPIKEICIPTENWSISISD